MKINSGCIRSADMRSFELGFTAHLLLKYLPVGSQVIICKHAVVFQKLRPWCQRELEADLASPQNCMIHTIKDGGEKEW